jgi:hypothetical protein
MPPLTLRIHVLDRHGRELRLWIPLFLLWLLLLPIALLILPVLFVVCVVVDIDPFRAVAAVLGVLSGLRDSRIQVDAAEASVFVHVI